MFRTVARLLPGRRAPEPDAPAYPTSGTLIVGLGNPGRKYERTRHNIGFMVLDTLAAALSASPWRDERQASVARATVDGATVLLAKPQTFMNNSGSAVQALATYYRVQPADILVVS